MKKIRISTLFMLVIAVAIIFPPGPGAAAEMEYVAPGMKMVDSYTLMGPKNFYNGFDAVNPDGTVNVVIEIPAGTNAKWEVSRKDGSIKWEFKSGKPRVVNYLGYPGNYGSIPRTLLPKELGGDGDPLDVIVAGPSLPRGLLVKCRLIGVLRLLDEGEQDDKLIAVALEGPLSDVQDVDALNARYPGVISILETWFVSYKGPDSGIVANGVGNAEQARKTLDATVRAFRDFSVQ